MAVNVTGDGQIIQNETTTLVIAPTKTVEVVTGGTQGPTGPAGPVGAVGPAGAGIQTVAGVPSNSLGVDGDYAINSLVEDLYRKVSGVWVRITDLDDIDAGFF